MLRVQFVQFIEGVVQSDQIEVASFEGQRVIQRQPESTIPFRGSPTARVLDENLTHQFRADGKKMVPVLKLDGALFF